MGVWDSFEEPGDEAPDVRVDPIAPDILSSFGIPYDSISGGTLEGIDIKRADALSTLKAALLEDLATKGTLVEIRINSSGEAEFYEVGSSSAHISPYYSIKSSSYIQPNVGVQVTGAKPKIERLTTNDWHQLIGPNSFNSTIHESTELSTGCMADGISNTAVITYKDPFRNGASYNWNDGVEDVYEPGPYERQIGTAWRIIPPKEEVSDFTQIHQQSQSSVPVLVSDGIFGDGGPNVGIPQKRKPITEEASEEDPGSTCDAFDSHIPHCSDTAVPLPLVLVEGLTYEILRNVGGEVLKVNKYNHVEGLFAKGIPLRSCYGVAHPGLQNKENTPENTGLYIFSRHANMSLYSFTLGVDYIQLYGEDAEGSDADLPCFQFANNLPKLDYATVGTNVDFYIDFKDEDLMTIYGGSSVGKGTVLPLENNGGLLIQQIWALVVLDTPSFLVTDPNNAKRIAEGLIVEIKPLAIVEKPSPIAINGKLIDQSADLQDSDPTTVQNFTNTPLQKAQEAMASGRTMNISLASLDEIATERLSGELYNILKDDDGKVYTHTCPPTDNPKVGEKGKHGGIINSIEYSYTDQGSYLINVVEGPKNFGDFAGIDGGVLFKRFEDVKTNGTIIFDKGNHMDYVVHVDGIGDIECINCCAQVLSARDRVSIMIHNNEVEE